MTYTLNFGVVWANAGELLGGLALGLALALSSIAIGAVIGLFGAFAAFSRSAALRHGVAAALIRNTPLLVIVLIAYFALPDLGLRFGKIESFVALMIPLAPLVTPLGLAVVALVVLLVIAGVETTLVERFRERMRAVGDH